jgi:hypothetical protein
MPKTSAFVGFVLMICTNTYFAGLVGTRTGKHFLSQASIKAQEYQTRFAELKLAFINEALVATEIVVVRTFSEVSNIGKFVIFFPYF